MIQLSAIPGRNTAAPAAGPSATSDSPPARRRTRGGDLIFGGVLALVLLIACLTWEVLSRPDETPHASASIGGQHAVIPAVH